MSSEFLKENENAEEKENGRKLFANKKANIALAVASAIILVAIVGLAIWANI